MAVELIEEALGYDAARVMPDRPSLLQCLAVRSHASVDDVLTRELEDLASAHADELASDVAAFETAMWCPAPAASAATRG